MTIKLLKIFVSVWISLIGLSVLLGIIGIFMSASSFTDGWGKFTQTFSPFNVANTLLIILLLLPAVGANKLREHLEKKKQPGNGKE